MRIYSVEIEPNGYEDDLFNGTFEECVEYCKKHDYTKKNSGARIAEIEVDKDGCVTYCYEIIKEW